MCVCICMRTHAMRTHARVRRSENDEKRESKIGDLLFAVVNLARHLGTNPEVALRNANRKFEKRFRTIETKLRENGKNLQESGLDELEMLWQEVKRDEGNKAP